MLSPGKDVVLCFIQFGESECDAWENEIVKDKDSVFNVRKVYANYLATLLNNWASMPVKMEDL